MMTLTLHNLRALALVACCATGAVFPAAAQTSQEGVNLGALAQENLKKPRPPASVDLTGTYNFDLTGGNGNPFTAYQFGPHPKLTAAAQAQLTKYQDFQKQGKEYRDDPGACWPLGVPRIMTRYWPIQIIQLPTMTVLISMFENNVRWIFTDGRKHPADDGLVYTYNGHSTGSWDGDTLVVDTVGLTSDHHWIEEGIPASDKLHVIERIKLTPAGFEDEFSLTDPDNWEGEWKSLKKYARDDHADIEEHTCIYEQMSKLPTFKDNIRG